jgi:hypothetical protein
MTRPLFEPTLAGRHDRPLPPYRDVRRDDEFPSVHLDRGYDSSTFGDLRDLLVSIRWFRLTALIPAPAAARSVWSARRSCAAVSVR